MLRVVVATLLSAPAQDAADVADEDDPRSGSLADGWLARRHGIHAGIDVAFSRDEAAVYLQIGSAWARP